MIQIDYSKIEINIQKITMSFLSSLYFYMMNYLTALFNYGYFSYNYAMLSLIVMLLGTFFLIKYTYSVCVKTSLVPLYIFISLVLISFFTRATSALICITASFVYSLYTLKLIYDYGLKQSDFINKYRKYIKFENFIAIFSIIFIIFLFYFLFLFFLNLTFIANNYIFFDSFFYLPVESGFFNVLQYVGNTFHDSILLFYILFPSSILLIIYTFYAHFLTRSQYVFILCPLSEYGQIPLSIITSKFNGNSNKALMLAWFKENIGNYIKSVYLDTENKMIIFENAEIKENYKENDTPILQEESTDYEYVIYSLDESIKKIDILMARVVHNGIHLTGVLYNMKSYLEKINILHKDKRKYNKNIDRINNRYIPYVEYLVDTYLQNILLRDEKINQLQEKIVESLNNILEVFKSMYESNMEYIAFNIENEIDAMELLIKQKGL